MAHPLLAWLVAQGGTVSEHVAIHEFAVQDGGRGMAALHEVDADTTLFSIPRPLLLSPRNSELQRMFGEHEWRKLCLHKGWGGLILCMMWEHAQGPASKWADYLSSMPTEFSTLMFWSEEELKDLQASYVTDKVGRDDAERIYHSSIVPALQSRPDLFLPAHAAYYSLERFHIMGSRILSRSFTVQDPSEGEEGSEGEGDGAHDRGSHAGEPPAQSGDGDVSMEDVQLGPAEEVPEHHDEDSDEEAEDEYATAMVPIADILNARTGSNNARLFQEKDSLRMVAIAPIPAGAQVWNTYGECANQDLLRKYGYVDVIPLENDKHFGNPSDIAEVKADLFVRTAVVQGKIKQQDTEERIEWWLEAGGDDVFDLDRSYEISQEVLSFSTLLLLNAAEWDKVRQKNKPPKRKPDSELLKLVLATLRTRAAEYTTSIEDDERLSASLDPERDWKKRNAVVVRLGEKRILATTIEKCDEMLVALSPVSKVEKRKASGTDSNARGKRQKR
ncbi:SET domain-containing protein [Auriculariales sp. MPI-PUGE-AT-0066]|nr:SET domain-containing protein [Auriculariales sp. MPI-PUGE-AT-0066]